MEQNKSLRHKFIIGDEWIYFKIYCGPKSADVVLTRVIKPITIDLLNQKAIDKWFFIRYADPDLHIRLRFHITEQKHILQVIALLNKLIKPFINKNIIWKMQADTYIREIERYGLLTMELSETLFFYDSICTTEMLSLIEGDEGEIIRWLFSILSIDCLLNDFQYSLEKKLELLETMKTSFGNEFGMNRNLKMQIDKKFRDERPVINNVLNREKDFENNLLPLFKLLAQRSEKTASVVNTIMQIDIENKLGISLNNLLGSYIHMLMNRLFKSKQRLHEMVIYDFLYRYYNSEIAKMKNINAND